MAIHLIFVTGGVCGEKFCHVEIKCGNWKLILFLVNIVVFGTKKVYFSRNIVPSVWRKLSQNYNCHVRNPIVRMNFNAEWVVNSTSRFRLIGDWNLFYIFFVELKENRFNLKICFADWWFGLLGGFEQDDSDLGFSSRFEILRAIKSWRASKR